MKEKMKKTADIKRDKGGNAKFFKEDTEDMRKTKV